MPENPIELGHVDVGDARAATGEQHVLVVGGQRVVRKIGRARAYQRVVGQWIDQQYLGMDEEDVTLVGRPRQFLVDEPLVETGVRNRRDLGAAGPPLKLDERLSEDRAVGEGKLAAVAF